jgi:hypothetical protein
MIEPTLRADDNAGQTDDAAPSETSDAANDPASGETSPDGTVVHEVAASEAEGMDAPAEEALATEHLHAESSQTEATGDAEPETYS